MRKNENFTLDVISKIDEDIVNDNLNKRSSLWFSRSTRKVNRLWIPIVAAAAAFVLIFGSVFMAMLGLDLNGKQVPIYQGMTVSNEAPAAKLEGGSGSFIQMPMPLFASIGGRFRSPMARDSENGSLAYSDGIYYAMPNEDIYIHVHISNPDGFEILSFTLNGVKYSSYMFEEGSDLETLILKYNVGDKNGINQYTIDAIKYVDGENIKDVRMEGDRTIEVIVGDSANDLSFNVTVNGWDIAIAPKWNESFEGEKKIVSLALYEGDILIRELDPDTAFIDNLPIGKRILLVATYLDKDKTVTVKTVVQTPKQSEGLHIVNGVVTGIGSCSDTILYINMPIADKAFSENTHITHVYLGSGVTSIGDYAFSKCQKITSISLPDSITQLGEYAFADCSALESANIPHAITKIPKGLFDFCIKLVKVDIPNGVTTIGMRAFAICPSLSDFTIPQSVTVIEEQAFALCEKITVLNLHEGLTTIGSAAFGDCIGITRITIPKSVTFIGSDAFSYCGKIDHMTILNEKVEGDPYWQNVSFDCIEFTCTYQELQDSILRELKYVLSPGGIIKCTDGNYGTNNNFIIKSGVYTSVSEGVAILNDGFNKGFIEATMTTDPNSLSSMNENGIVFALTDSDNDGSVRGSDGEYYFLFISHTGGIRLEKVESVFRTTLAKVGAANSGVTHGDKLVMRAEYDGNGNIKCYLNGKLVIEYTDDNPLKGSGCGLCAGCDGTVYENITVSAS